MRRIVYLLLVAGLLSVPTAGITGCGGTESGTQQITQKASPDPETAEPSPKAAKPRKGSRW
jgi:hypothetical protein